MTDAAAVAIRPRGDGCTIAVRVQSRASRNGLAGVQGEALRVRLTAPPVNGQANAALEAFLAEVLDVPRSAVAVVAGHTGRQKLVAVMGLDPATARVRLGAA